MTSPGVFTHDAFGQRLTRSEGGVTQNYTWNYALGLPSISISEEGGQATYFIHTPSGALLHQILPDGSRRFHHFDEMGSTLFLTDDAGAITDRYVYGPYGEPAGRSGRPPTPSPSAR